MPPVNNNQPVQSSPVLSAKSSSETSFKKIPKVKQALLSSPNAAKKSSIKKSDSDRSHSKKSIDAVKGKQK